MSALDRQRHADGVEHRKKFINAIGVDSANINE
jgi:hypothetical protein